ncbi:MAG: BNR-4 repeat-containing protein [bacterium]
MITVATGFAFGEDNIFSHWKVEQSWDIAEVPSEFPVGFSLLTEGEHQYVAYFDKNRQMTVASRKMNSDQWQYQTLPSKVGVA